MREHRGTYVAVCVMALLLATGMGVAAAETTVLEVTVTDSAGDPVDGTTVQAEWENGTAEGTTLVDGVTRMEVESGANLTITAAHDRLVRNHPVEITNYDGDSVAVTMFPPGTATITVTDEDGPVENAAVRLWKPGDDRFAARGMTDQNGEYSTPTIEEGDYNVRVEKPGYSTEQDRLTVDNATTAEYEINAESVNLNVVTQDGVTEEQIDANITVRTADGVFLQTRTTADRGTRTISLPVNTAYEITFDRAGYDATERSIEIGEDDQTLTANLTRTPALTLAPGNSRIVVGEDLRVEVTDEYDRPAANVTVEVDGDTATTNDNGVARVTVAQTGELNLTAQRNGVTAEPVTITAITGQEDGTDEETAGADGQPGLTVFAAVGVLLAVGIGAARRS